METLLLYGGNPDLTDSYKEYHKVANTFASKNIRVLIPNAYPLKYFDDFPITGVCEFDSVTGTKLDYELSAVDFAERHGIKHYRIDIEHPVEEFKKQKESMISNNVRKQRRR